MGPSLWEEWLLLLRPTQFCCWLSRWDVSLATAKATAGVVIVVVAVAVTTAGFSTPSWSSVSVSSILVNSLSVDCGVLSIRDAITAFWYCCRVTYKTVKVRSSVTTRGCCVVIRGTELVAL